MLRPLVLLLCYPFLAAFAEPDWWKTSILYQIYPRSYADSNGDGDGDLNGIRQHVEHLKSIGVGIVWLSPIYNSPWQDMGYDISDYKSVHPKFGTLEDAKALIQKLHSEGIKIFMDLVPNHSSIEHPWFNASRHGQEPERDYYVWKDPKDRKGDDIFPPNNWLSAFDGDSAWEYDEIRKQFYLHHFGKYQADLNYSNPKLVEAMKDNMRFWLDLGVDGFRVDTPGFLAEHPDFPDEPWIENCTSSLKYNCLEHIYTTNQPRTYEVLHQFQEMLEKEYNSDKYMILEVFAPWDQWKGYYGPLMAPFNFLLVNDLWKDTNAKKLQSIVSDYMTNIPKGIWPNWVLGNHDNTRVATRMGVDAVDATNMLILLLPGTSINYQGEEIGMEDGHVRKYEILDCCNRDPQRTPMQWTSGTNAGFSTGNKTWLPVNSNYWNINVETQSHDSKSHLSTYKRLATATKVSSTLDRS